MQNILLIRLSSLGDIILTFPLINKIKGDHPECKISFIAKKKFTEILRLHPYIDEIIEFDENSESGIASAREVIKKNNFDLILDLQKNFLSYKITRYYKGTIRRIKKDNFKKYLLVKFKWNTFKRIVPVYQKYIRTYEDSDQKFPFTSSPLMFDRDRKYPGNYTLVAPCAKHYTKTFPAWKFIDYFHKYSDKTFIIVGENNEREQKICNKIYTECNNVINLCGELDLSELSNYLFYAEKIICNDSAVLHLSEALGQPVTAIFGNTVEEFGFFPQIDDSITYEMKGLYCRPCSHIGRESCPEGHFKCMDEIELLYNFEFKKIYSSQETSRSTR